MIYEQMPFLTIHWDEEVKCVLMEWHDFAEGEEFRKGLDTGLELLKKKGTSKWLADLRNMRVVAAEDQQWSNNDWFPRALKAGIKYMALVQPKQIIAKMSVEKIMNKVEGTNLVTHHFDNLEEAKNWLGTK